MKRHDHVSLGPNSERNSAIAFIARVMYFDGAFAKIKGGGGESIIRIVEDAATVPGLLRSAP
jgi:hypothetical protein